MFSFKLAVFAALMSVALAASSSSSSSSRSESGTSNGVKYYYYCNTAGPTEYTNFYNADGSISQTVAGSGDCSGPATASSSSSSASSSSASNASA